MSQINVANQASVATPSSGQTTLYVDSTDKLLKSRNDAGVVTNYGAPGTAITALTGEVTASGPGSAAATVTQAAVVGKQLTGLATLTGTIQSTDTVLQAFGKLVNKQNNAIYPSLAMGAQVIAANTTLTADLYCDTLVVNSGAVLTTGGFRIFAKTSIVNNGTIDRSGNDATGTAATAALTAGTLGPAGAGGAGGTAAGSAGGASAVALGGTAGAGGATGSAGGAAGTLTLVAATAGGVDVFNDQGRARLGYSVAGTQITGGAGGGGGAGDGTAGGAGGGGGGILVLITRSLTGTGLIQAKGGMGFQPIAGNRGGGGGGGGGVIACITENDVTATSLTLSVAGGSGASGSGTGGSGVAGTNGRIYLINA